MKSVFIVSAVILLITAGLAYGAGAGTDSLNFLKIKPSARGASLGDGFVAAADDASGAFYNPAALRLSAGMEVSLMHMLYVAGTSYEFGAFSMPLSDRLTAGIHVIYLNYGNILRTFEDGAGNYDVLASTGSYAPADLAAAFSAGYSISDNFSAGLTVKYAAENIDMYSVTAFLFDAGVIGVLDGINLGASVYNIGAVSDGGISPLYARAGASVKLDLQSEKDLLVAAGISYIAAGSNFGASAGAEYTYEGLLVLRGSYTYGADLDSVNLGAGLKGALEGIKGEVGYNFSLLGDLEPAHRISLSMKFEDEVKASPKKTGSSKVKPGSAIKYYFKK